jgi:transcriptional regulator with XRE-family HTH domain
MEKRVPVRKLRLVRLQKGLSSWDLARACRVNPVSVRQWEYGFSSPTAERRRILEELLGAPWEELAKIVKGGE